MSPLATQPQEHGVYHALQPSPAATMRPRAEHLPARASGHAVDDQANPDKA